MTDKEMLVPAAYTLPLEVKERIEQLARKEDLNPSQLARRIFRDYLKHIDVQTGSVTQPPTPQVA
jgi:hypothetical protein